LRNKARSLVASLFGMTTKHMERPTVYVETYGCQMNVSDSELMLGLLSEAGFPMTVLP
jgi:hypothetical protein